MQDKGPRSATRVISILRALAEAPDGLPLTEIIRITDTPKSTLLGILVRLTEAKAVEKEGSGLYTIGTVTIDIASSIMLRYDHRTLMHRVLVNLSKETGETAALVDLDSTSFEVIFSDKAESRNSIRYSFSIGERRELHCTVGGKVYLAFLPEDELDRYFRTIKRERFTAQTQVDEADIRRSISEIRQSRLARTRDERALGASGLAAPIFGPDEQMLSVVMIAGPTTRMATDAGRNAAAVIAAAGICQRILANSLSPRF